MRTVKLFLVLAVAAGSLLLTAAPGQAQVRFAIGPRVGINFGGVSIDPEVPWVNNLGQQLQATRSGRTGMVFGAAFELSFARMFGAEVALTYVMKGASYDIAGGQATARFKLNELNIPMLFKVRFLQGQIQPYAFIGPNLGFTLSATRSLEIQGQQQAAGQAEDTDISNEVGGFDFALDFGGGTEFLIARNIGIFGDIRYSFGLTNLYKAPAVAPQQGQAVVTPSWKPNGFQVQFGALFHL